jgi:hypothetical protein
MVPVEAQSGAYSCVYNRARPGRRAGGSIPIALILRIGRGWFV